MNSYHYGQGVRLRAEFRDPETRTLESPSTLPVCAVTKPDGSTLTPVVTEVSEGIFTARVVPTQAEQGVWVAAYSDPDGPGLDEASSERTYFLVRD